MLKSSNCGYYFNKIYVDLCNIAELAATAIATAAITTTTNITT